MTRAIRTRCGRSASCAVALVLAVSGMAAAQQSEQRGAPADEHPAVMAKAIPFAERNGKKVFNASGIVPLADSRFLFCDNNAGQALYELDLGANGEASGPVVPHPLAGPGVDAVDDIEGLTIASERGRQVVFATSSLSMKTSKKTGESKPLPGLVRIRPTARGPWRAEVMPGFREWLLRHLANMKDAATRDPDEAGLNVEGLAWDPVRRALLFGVRSPVEEGKPVVISVRVRNVAGPWRTSNLEAPREIPLAIESEGADQGIRSIEYDSVRKLFLVVVGRSVSKTATPFRLYTWDGDPAGTVTRRGGLEFDPEMKPEGVTSGTIGGRRATVFVDDEGGYMVIWGDDPRLR